MRVRVIEYMEAITGIRAWVAMPLQARELFQALRSPAGEAMILEQNSFIEKLLPLSMLRALTPEEHDDAMSRELDELAERARNGERAALEGLLRDLQDLLYRLALRSLLVRSWR